MASHHVLAGTCAALIALGAAARAAHADGVAQPLPFAEDWTDSSRLSVVNDWSRVPGLVCRRGDHLTTGSSQTDPQQVLGDGTATPLDLHPNLTSVENQDWGGCGSLVIANPLIALQASPQGVAPHLVLTLDTTGAGLVHVAYDLVDVETGDDAVEPVALHYRVGTSGSFINVPAAFIADATSPGTGQVTHVDVYLPPDAAGVPHLELRWMVVNQPGKDEFVGIDNLAVAAVATLGATATIAPPSVTAGTPVQLTVVVTPLPTPTSNGIAVHCDLSALGGTADALLYDDGTHGDASAGDDLFTRDGTVPATTAAGVYPIACTARDAQGRSVIASTALTVLPVCGDGRVDTGETCDDGGVAGGDGCSAACQVEPGYHCSGAPSVCGDIDECAAGSDDCASLAICTNTPGGYTCACPGGTTGDGHGAGGCVDVDECATGTDDCTPLATCTNTPGSFGCACPAGYEGDGHGSDGCEDVDECASSADDCDVHASCTNTAGGFTCACDDGWHGDGVTCATVCGDGVIAGAETCDDGNTTGGDGCSASCAIDDGWSCTGAPSTCIADRDHDGVPDAVDNCPSLYNPGQTDSDHDGIGDPCDSAAAPHGGCGVADPGAGGGTLAFLAFSLAITRLRRRISERIYTAK